MCVQGAPIDDRDRGPAAKAANDANSVSGVEGRAAMLVYTDDEKRSPHAGSEGLISDGRRGSLRKEQHETREAKCQGTAMES